MPELSSAKKFQFIGGNLALDFCNSVGGKRGGIARENLNSYFDLVAWCFQAGLMDRAQAETSLKHSEREPDSGAGILVRAVQLRESLFRIFEAFTGKRSPPRSDIEVLNSELARSLGRMQLAPPKDGDCFAWRWATEQSALDHALGPIAHAAAMLLTDPQHLRRVEICHGDTCGWLFVDLSKNHSRRWCDMRDCGNRAKIRRHRLKQRKHEH